MESLPSCWPAPPPAGARRVPRRGRGWGWGWRAAAACAALSCPARGRQVWPNRVAVQCAGFPGDGLSVVARCSGYCLTRGCLTAGCARSPLRGLSFPGAGPGAPSCLPAAPERRAGGGRGAEGRHAAGRRGAGDAGSRGAGRARRGRVSQGSPRRAQVGRASGRERRLRGCRWPGMAGTEVKGLSHPRGNSRGSTMAGAEGAGASGAADAVGATAPARSAEQVADPHRQPAPAVSGRLEPPGPLFPLNTFSARRSEPTNGFGGCLFNMGNKKQNLL